ncbi:hypothetical protein WDV85_16555 [Pseudokineococcus sp. 5B2Z-1]|uniref:hypothetical protein n=1 Tax=Pseudokineococcus sp. 5B2Z-1 TaxID=3132744 RepID=UPI0030A1B3E5
MSEGEGPSRAAQQRHALLAPTVPEEPDGARPPAGGGSSTTGARGGGRRHCWVILDDVAPMPGVVTIWNRTGAGWLARVAYVVDDAGTVATGWLPASLLRPHDPAPPPLAGEPTA